MEDVRKPKIIHYLLVAVILVTAVVSIPSTTAKYSTQKNYRINIETKLAYRYILKQNKMSDGPGKSTAAVSYTAEESGYYVFIAKGGNGAAGMCAEADNSNPLLYSNSSTGGLVYGCIYLNKNDVLKTSVGSSASDPYRKRNTVTSTSGRNSLNGTSASVGGNGSYYKGPIGTGTKNSSGSGGGATIITKGNSLIAVAGGGGGGGASDPGLTIFFDWAVADGGKGGNGGSVTNPASNKDTSHSGYIVYYGFAGEPSDNGGSGGQKSSVLTYSNNRWTGGNGGSGNNNSFGAGGGGGYAGGSGGSGTGAGKGAGGGGGGSSYIVRTLNNNDTLGLKNTELSKVYALVNNSGYSASQREGFVIIAYIENGTQSSAISAYSSGNIS